MRLLLLLLLCSPRVFANPVSRASVDENPEGRPPFVIDLRGGFLLKNPDRATLDRWEHKSAESYQMTLAGYYSFPQAWKQFYFFAGPEFTYQSATEELSGYTYTASLDISVYRFYLAGGLAYQPYFLGGDWGLSFTTAFEVFGRKTAVLDAQGFTQDLGTESTQRGNGVLPKNFNLILAFYYDYKNFRPKLFIDSAVALGLGMDYAF